MGGWVVLLLLILQTYVILILQNTPNPPIKRTGELDFLKVYGYMRVHAAYATRRVWRVFSVRGWALWPCRAVAHSVVLYH